MVVETSSTITSFMQSDFINKNFLITIVSMMLSGFIGAYINEFFRNYPIFSLRFKLVNKNLEYYNLKVGLFLARGVAKDIEWKVICKTNNNYVRDFLNLQYGKFDILKENESRFLFDIHSNDYKNYRLYENTEIVIKFKIFTFIPRTQSLKLDLRKYLSFDDLVNSNNPDLKELINQTSSLKLEAEKEFKEKFNA